MLATVLTHASIQLFPLDGAGRSFTGAPRHDAMLVPLPCLVTT